MKDSRNVSVRWTGEMKLRKLYSTLIGLVHETSRVGKAVGKAVNFIRINQQKIVVHCNSLLTH